MEFLRLEIDRPALPVIAGVVHFDGKSGAGGHVNGKGREGKGEDFHAMATLHRPPMQQGESG